MSYYLNGLSHMGHTIIPHINTNYCQLTNKWLLQTTNWAEGGGKRENTGEQYESVKTVFRNGQASSKYSNKVKYFDRLPKESRLFHFYWITSVWSDDKKRTKQNALCFLLCLIQPNVLFPDVTWRHHEISEIFYCQLEMCRIMHHFLCNRRGAHSEGVESFNWMNCS